MVERHVYVKFKAEHSNPSGRRAAIDGSQVLATIPGVISVRVGLPADPYSLAAWDMCLCLTFESLAAVEPYRTHPAHQQYLKDFLDPRTEVKKAWNFEV